MIVLDAGSFQISRANGSSRYTFTNVQLKRGESGLLVWADNSAREVFFNSIFGWADARHLLWKTDGEILTLKDTVEGEPKAVLVSRNPENQLSGCFQATSLEFAIPLALNGTDISKQHANADFLLAAFGLSMAAEWPAGTLSSGQKQRLLLASAISICKSLLLVDGPMEFIDPMMRQRLLAFILQFCQARDVSCLFAASSEHSLNAHAFDKVFIINSDSDKTVLRYRNNAETRRVRYKDVNSPNVLVIRGLEYIVPNSHVRLYCGLTFTVPSSAGVVLCGPNGSGKSTLAHIIAGRLTPSVGQVLVNGVQASEWFEQLRPQVSLSFSDPDLTITQKSVRLEIDAVAAGLMPGDLYAEILSILGLHSEFETNPFDLNWQARRRLCLAKAIKAARTILFVDEPAADADIDEREAIASALGMCVNIGLLVIVATNDDYLAGLIGFDQIVYLPAPETVVERREILNADRAQFRSPEISDHSRERNSSSDLGTAWMGAAAGWLQRTAEFSLFWDKNVYPKLLPILAELRIDGDCALVDLGCGHGMHTAIVARFLKQNGVAVSSVIGVDSVKRFVTGANTLFCIQQNIEFYDLDLTNLSAVANLAKRLKGIGSDLIFTAFFSLHDMSTLDGIKLLLDRTKKVGGVFVAVLLSPNWVRNSDVVSDRTLAADAREKAGSERVAIDWEWVGWYPVSTESSDALYIPYFFRELSVYDEMLGQFWLEDRPATSVYSDSVKPADLASAVGHGACREDEVIILWTDYRGRSTGEQLG
jgi:energy-coupling factor transporter ATP-binding protein EcfA2/SAM-dependent methyltransferase